LSELCKLQQQSSRIICTVTLASPVNGVSDTDTITEHNCSFQLSWLSHNDYKLWLKPLNTDEHFVYCSVSARQFDVTIMGMTTMGMTIYISYKDPNFHIVMSIKK
jgi:hypothetical protein